MRTGVGFNRSLTREEMNEIKTVSVFGLGKLGACIAATMAQRGVPTLGVDIDPEKVRRVNKGLAPVEEQRLTEAIRDGQSRLHATLDVSEAVKTDASFFIPPSPSLPDGSFSSEYLLKAMHPLAAALKASGKRGHLFVCSSTTTPGACDRILIPMIEKETGWKCGVDFGFCYNPEFIALGNVVNGLLEPDLVLIGESDVESGAALERLYKVYNRNRPLICRMSIISAELTKISVNSYITMKISFTNQLRMISERFAGANIHHILGAIGSDSRIGNKYLRAGLSYGGPCFPRDNRLLAYAAEQVGVRAPLAETSDRINESTKQNLLEQVKKQVAKDQVVAILGLAYKPDTYIVEESAGLYLAQTLKRHGYKVIVHDCGATPTNCPSLHEFEVVGSLEALAKRSDVKLVVVCCPWPEYQQLKLPPGSTMMATWDLAK